MGYSVDEDFFHEWVDTTDGWLQEGKAYWINDRPIGRRPCVHTKYWRVFDKHMCETTSPCVPEGSLLKRRLPEEYGQLLEDGKLLSMVAWPSTPYKSCLSTPTPDWDSRPLRALRPPPLSLERTPS